jgi:hypothetical protein
MLRTKLAPRIMAATFGLTCLLAAATSHARVLVSNITVKCVEQNEIGEDEIYLRFNGTRFNMGNFSNGVNRTSSSTIILPSLPMSVELWESDGDHWYDRDDFWDSFTCTSFALSCLGGSSNHYDGQHHLYYWSTTLTSVP